MVTGRPRSESVAFHKESPRASHEEPHGLETWSSRLIRSSSRNRPPSKLAVLCVPGGVSTTVIDYLLPSPDRVSHALKSPHEASDLTKKPRKFPDHSPGVVRSRSIIRTLASRADSGMRSSVPWNMA